VDLAVADEWFGEMVDHETLIGEALHQFERGRQLARIDKDVVGEIEFLEHRYSAQKILANQETIVGFGLSDMAEAAQLFESREILKTLRKVTGAKINPSDHTGNFVVIFGQVQKKFGFLLGLVGLNGNGCIDILRLTLRAEVRGKKVAFQDRHFVRDPL